eukprot:GFUD01071687.1.p1 GENE.GFUD01071687.1~~GFUD01071687.1.p1  ORF type:complete len:121 (+),score=12.94 GFUD01071687.1:126-488(+)
MWSTLYRGHHHPGLSDGELDKVTLGLVQLQVPDLLALQGHNAIVAASHQQFGGSKLNKKYHIFLQQLPSHQIQIHIPVYHFSQSNLQEHFPFGTLFVAVQLPDHSLVHIGPVEPVRIHLI